MKQQTSQPTVAIILLVLMWSSTHAGVVTLDLSFNKTGYRIQSIDPDGAFGRSVGVQTDGKIVLGGWTVGPTAFAAMRLNPDGSLDTSFSGDGIVITQYSVFNQVEKLLIQPDGKIVLGGTRHFGQNDFAMIRYTTGGDLDTSFDGDGRAASPINVISEDLGKDMALQNDGKIVMVGTTAADTTSPTDIGMIRRNPNGSLDPGFGGTGIVRVVFQNANASANSVLIQQSGKIVIGGYVFNGVSNSLLLMRFHTNGMLDTTFGTGGLTVQTIGGIDHTIRTLSQQSDGKILAGSQNVVARFTVDGLLDKSFANDGVLGAPQSVEEILVLSDDNFMIGGSGGSGVSVSRYQPNGSIDQTFNGTGSVTAGASGYNCTGSSLALRGDNKFVVGGTCANAQTFTFAVFSFSEANEADQAPFDFDGDGRTDVSIFRPGPGEWWYLRSSDGGNFAAQFGAETDVIVPGDYTGDGKADFAFFRPSTGEWFVLRSEDFSFYAFPFGTGTDIPAPADYDGDGRTDPAVFRPSTGTWFIVRSSDGQVTITTFGTAGDQPVAGDFDGDGSADIAIFRPNGASGAEWWIQRSTDGLIAAQFGQPTDKAAAGDYTGDGKTDMALFRPSTGEWFVLRSEDFSFYAFPFGTNGDLPAPGDYDGDGRMDAAVFRPSSATWFMQGSTSGTVITPFGQAGDQPVPSSFVR